MAHADAGRRYAVQSRTHPLAGCLGLVHLDYLEVLLLT